MKLQTCQIVGFFSMPSPYLAEHNPSAYNNAMAGMPHGAGSCAHCGTGIIHHVVVRDENGERAFIGTTCAEKVGLDRECVRNRMTSEQKAERDARWQARRDAQKAQDDAWQAEIDGWRARHLEVVGELIALLEAAGSEFHASLASQLRNDWLSPRQAHFVAKLTSETGRRNKKNAQAWDSVIDLCTGCPDGEERPDFYAWRKAYQEPAQAVS